MPKAKPKTKARKTIAKKPAAKKAKPAAAKSAKPVKAAKPEPAPAAPQPEPAPAAPVMESTQAAAAKPQKPLPHHPGKPEQPLWARFNHGHAQKMSKGRNFRHQGR